MDTQMLSNCSWIIQTKTLNWLQGPMMVELHLWLHPQTSKICWKGIQEKFENKKKNIKTFFIYFHTLWASFVHLSNWVWNKKSLKGNFTSAIRGGLLLDVKATRVFVWFFWRMVFEVSSCFFTLSNILISSKDNRSHFKTCLVNLLFYYFHERFLIPIFCVDAYFSCIKA